MTSRDFCYWLQGFLEMSQKYDGSLPNVSIAGVECIAKHLALVFKHEIDPNFGDSKKQEDLNKIHSGPSGMSTGLDKNTIYRC